MIKLIGGGAAIGLLIATISIVQNTIRLTVFARRREIKIMQLVGATSAFIRFPMLLEGILYGFFGGFLASVIVLLCGRQVSAFIAQVKSPLFTDLPTNIGPAQVLYLLTLMGAVIGFFGSWMSLRRFLKQV